MAIPHGTLELISDTQSIAPGRHFNLGLHFQLEKGWHIYWVNPGDSGEPPRVEWHLPASLSAGAIEWPAPERFQSSTIVDYGYENGVLLIVPVTVGAHPSTQAQPSTQATTQTKLGALVKLLVCSHEMCIPGKADLSLALPIHSAQPAPETHNADLFALARKSLPKPMPAAWKLSAAETSDSFELAARRGDENASAVTSSIFFPQVDSQIENAAPQKFASVQNGFHLTLRKSDR